MRELILGLPAKGRLKDNALAYLAEAELNISHFGHARNYHGRIREIESVVVRFLSPDEIVGALINGQIHLGITGLDLVEERAESYKDDILDITPLGFGHADLVIAVPRSWIDVNSLAELADIISDHYLKTGRRLRVATKYARLTRRFLARSHITDYRIAYSTGATEGAPAADSADLIVDISSTGATLEANGLRPLADGLILSSQAYLFGALKAEWNAELKQCARTFLSRIAARRAASDMYGVRAFFAKAPPAESISQISATGKSRILRSGEELYIHCHRSDLSSCSELLRDLDAEAVDIVKLEYIFANENSYYDILLKHIESYHLSKLC